MQTVVQTHPCLFKPRKKVGHVRPVLEHHIYGEASPRVWELCTSWTSSLSQFHVKNHTNILPFRSVLGGYINYFVLRTSAPFTVTLFSTVFLYSKHLSEGFQNHLRFYTLLPAPICLHTVLKVSLGISSLFLLKGSILRMLFLYFEHILKPSPFANYHFIIDNIDLCVISTFVTLYPN